jgi:arginase
MGPPLGLIGVPSSAGAFAPGQEDAPGALRESGLVEALRDLTDLRDHGDRPVWRWRPDRGRPRAQNLEQVIATVKETSRLVGKSIAEDEVTLILGGDCTVGIGTVDGHVGSGDRVGLIYFDAHADLNVPSSFREGALDWTGLAHMLGVEGAVAELVGACGRVPLLEADQVLLFAWDPEQATSFERDRLERRGIKTIPVAEVGANPEGAAIRARELMGDGCERLLVHFDVDVIDFTDVPLSENTGRNQGLSYEHAMSALGVLLHDPRLAGLTITELNPSHAESEAGSIERFARDVATRLAAGLA